MNRFSALDVRAVAEDLQKSVLSYRVANIHNVGPRSYLFKLHHPSKPTHLLIEAGIRMHTTDFTRPKPPVPSVFTVKLRKALRTKRLSSVRQLGVDRTLQLTFGSPPVVAHLFIEFYSKGNIVLTDDNLTIQAVLRTFKDEEKGLVVAVGEKYDVENTLDFVPLTKERLVSVLERGKETKEESKKEESAVDYPDDPGLSTMDTTFSEDTRTIIGPSGQKMKKTKTELRREARRLERKEAKANKVEKAQKKKRGRASKGKMRLKDILGQGLAIGPTAAEEAIVRAGLRPTTLLTEFKVEDGVIDRLFLALREMENILYGSSLPPAGFLVYRKDARRVKKEQLRQVKGTAAAMEDEKKGDSREGDGQAPTEDEPVYSSYAPIRYTHYGADYVVEEVESFSKAVDAFFSQKELQKGVRQLEGKEKEAMSKFQYVKKDQLDRIETLRQEEDFCAYKAKLIEDNAEDVTRVIEIIRSALANSMGWAQLETLVKEEQRNGNAIAMTIHKLKLAEQLVTLLLSPPEDPFDESGEESEEEDQEAGEGPVPRRTHAAMDRENTLVDVDVSLSAHANARGYYDKRRALQEKRRKTEEAVGQAVKQAERKAFSSMKTAPALNEIRRIRKKMWFEKFLWFISSDGLIVVGGRDAQQNEILVKRYLRKGDIYVHADMHGAPTVIVKNNMPDHPIPPNTISQAGTMSVAFSSSWKAKIVANAWWVEAHQVSKTAPTGEYLTVGSFMIRGKKNFLPPAPLIMGFGFLFRLDESSPSVTTAAAARQERSQKEQTVPEAIKQGPTGSGRQHEEEEEKDVELLSWKTTNLALASQLPEEEEEEEEEIGEAGARSEDGSDEGEDEDDNGDGEGRREPSNEDLEESGGVGDGKGEDEEAEEEEEEEDEDEDEEEEGEEGEGEEVPKDEGGSAAAPGSADAAEYGGKVGRITAKQRRLIKAGKITIEEALEGKGRKEASGTGAADSSQVATSTGGEQSGSAAGGSGGAPQQLSRRQRNKKRKMKQKYGDQDDEERLVSMRVLGTAGATGGEKVNPGEAKTENGKQEKDARIAVAASGVVAEGEGQPDGTPGEDKKGRQTVEEDREKIRAARVERRKEKRTEKEEIEHLLAQENVLAAEMLDSLSELDKLFSAPTSDDTLLHAIPMCAPYSALNGFKYRCKLTPGGMKRGKLAKAAVSLFLRDPTGSQREKDLLKFTPENEIILNILSDAKITAPGLKKAIDGKKGNKGKGKQKKRK